MTHLRRSTMVGLLLVSAACSDPPALAGRHSRIVDTGPSRVVQIDGKVCARRNAPVTADEPQILIVTDRNPGADQSCVLVFDDMGKRLARHDLGKLTPYLENEFYARQPGERLRELPQPVANSVAVLEFAGRRLVILPTVGNLGASALHVLEATAFDALTLRLEFWNSGNIESLDVDGKPPDAEGEWLVVEGDWLVTFGWDNARTDSAGEFGRAVAIFSLSRLFEEAAEGAAPLGVAPQEGHEGEPRGPGFEAYIALPFDEPGKSAIDKIRLDDGIVCATFGTGLEYRIDPSHVDLVIEVEVTSEYRRAFRDRTDIPPSMNVDRHIDSLVLAARKNCVKR